MEAPVMYLGRRGKRLAILPIYENTKQTGCVRGQDLFLPPCNIQENPKSRFTSHFGAGVSTSDFEHFLYGHRKLPNSYLTLLFYGRLILVEIQSLEYLYRPADNPEPALLQIVSSNFHIFHSVHFNSIGAMSTNKCTYFN
jgi:hypothetical protein